MLRRLSQVMAGSLLLVTVLGCTADRLTLFPYDQFPSGIRGICMVTHNPGTPHSSGPIPNPEEGVTITVRDGRNQRTLIEVESGKDGEYCIHLLPGIYQVQASQGPFSSSHSQSIEVRAGEFSRVTLDVGINHP
jgi:hypothetical protein